MKLSDERIKEFQEIYKKEYGKELSWEEATEAARNLMNLAELIYDCAQRDFRLKQKLKEHPKGFHVEGEGYTCFICGRSVSNEETWYDGNSVKCLLCQKAFDKKILPKSVGKNKDLWYSIWEFDYHFGIKSPTVRKFIRHGKLKARVIPNEEGKPYCEILLIKDNLGVLPQKPESYLVQDENKMTHVEYKPVILPDFLEEIRNKK